MNSLSYGLNAEAIFSYLSVCQSKCFKNEFQTYFLIILHHSYFFHYNGNIGWYLVLAASPIVCSWEPEMVLQSATGFMLQDLMWHGNKKGFVSTDTSCLVATKTFWTGLVRVGCSQNIVHFCCFLFCGLAHFIMVSWNFPPVIFQAIMIEKCSSEVFLCFIYSSPLQTLHWSRKVILCLYFQLWRWHCVVPQPSTSSPYLLKSCSAFFNNTTQTSLMSFSQIILYTQEDTRI